MKQFRRRLTRCETFLLTFAGVGLRTNFSELKTQGLRPFAVGAIGEVVIAIVTLGLVLGAAKVFHLQALLLVGGAVLGCLFIFRQLIAQHVAPTVWAGR